MEYKKSEIKQFAKDCCFGSKALIDGICVSEEITHNEIRKELVNNEKLLLEVSKYFAKYTNDRMVPDVESGEVQDFCYIISTIVEYCEKNNWFEDNIKSK